jgi:hypothetical protein
MGLAILVLIMSIIAIFAPRITWFLSTGWRFKNAEPSDLVLSLNRIGGVIATVISVFVIVTSLGNSVSQNNWVDKFVERLETDQVDSISIGVFDNIRLENEEDKNIANIIRNIDMEKRDVQNLSGFSEVIVIDFIHHNQVKIYNLGSKFWIETDEVNVEYHFTSKALQDWLNIKLEE